MKVTKHSIKLLCKAYKNIYDFFTYFELCDILSNIKRHRNETIADAFLSYVWDEYSIRQCSVCGELMQEGYYLDGNYACCDSCRIDYYMTHRGCNTAEEAKKAYEKDYQEDDSNFYYTQWY